MDLLDPFDAARPVVGMVHLPPLPGSPGYESSRGAVRDRALDDAGALLDGGVDGILVENFGDAPFHPESVPKHVVADMTAIVAEIVDAADVPVGVNVLRNDAAGALSVAAATGASFVRCNVHVGAAVTDRGILEGRAHETLRLRDRIDAPVAVLADVHVKHAARIGGAAPDLERAARETIDRGLADGVIVSGPGTGEETAVDDVERVAETLATPSDDRTESAPLFVGSGVTPANVGDLFAAGADGVIVGSALEADGVAGNPVSTDRVRALVEAADAPDDR